MSPRAKEPSGRLDIQTERRGAAVRGVIRRPYAAVPYDILTDDRITLADRTVVAIMLALLARPSWTLYVAHVLRVTGLSAGGWVACRRRLEVAGYYRASQYREPGGRWGWDIVVTDTPGDFGDGDDSTIPHAVRGHGVMGHGEVDRRSSTDAALRTKSSSMHTSPSSTPTGMAGAAAPRAERGERKRKRTHGPTGVAYWYSDEVAEIDRIVAEHGVAAVRNQVQALRAAGTEPLPRVVEAALMAAKRQDAELAAEAAKVKAKAEAEAKREALRSDPATAAAAERNLAAMLRTLRG